MERLTERNNDGTVGIGVPLRPYNYNDIKGVLERLADYEDTGLDPQEVERIADAYRQGMTLRTESAVKLRVVRDISLDRLRELVEADRVGRVWIIPKCEGKMCGACGHFQRIPGTRRGKCDVRPYANSKWRGSGGDKREFEPSQSHIACNQFVPADCTDSGGGNAGT